MNPVEEFLSDESDGVEKTAGFWKAMKEPMKQVGIAAGGTLASAVAMGGAALGYKAIQDSIQKSRGFKSMLQENPNLRKMDRSKVQRMYNTLYHVSPMAATDPMISGSWTKRMIHNEEYIDPQTVQTLATAEQRARTGVPFLGLDPSRTSVMLGQEAAKGYGRAQGTPSDS